MKQFTIRQVARLAGVSVRMLHHYDRIGLLTPGRAANGYRLYGTEALLRLQQILLHRELGIPLAEIGAIIDASGFDRITALMGQREKLAAEAQRFARLVETIDRTIAALKGELEMDEKELYGGISPDNQAEYEAWLVDRYGGDMPQRIAESRKAYAQMAAEQQQAAMRELADVESALAEAMQRGIPADVRVLDPLLARHRAWVGLMWGRACPPEAFAGLADLHLAHPDFVARYEAIAPGFSDYHAAAMKAYAARAAA